MRVKRHLRGVLDRGARALGVLARFERRMKRGVSVLMYHRVLPDAECDGYPFPSLVMPLSSFREQVRWLAANARVAPLAELVGEISGEPAHGGGGSASERPRVAITFDDGYADNALHAAPALEEQGLRGTFYVATGFVERRETLWFDAAMLALSRDERALATARRALSLGADADPARCVEGLKSIARERRRALLAPYEPADALKARFAPMNVADVRALAAAGHEIGSHGVDHEIFVHVDERTLERELAESRATLERWTGRPVAGLAYPNGDCDARVVAAARAAGYAYACATAHGRNEPGCDPLCLARIDVTRERVSDARGRFDELAFRAELALWHEALR